MDSPQSVVSPFNGPFGFEKQNSNHFGENAGCLSKGNGVQRNEAALNNVENIIGVLEVLVHQARDIHNICIYHKQDVYAKLCVTSDPENTVSTKTINGGGQNPVFNDAVRLNVRTVDASLKCEIWMLSRVKNYLEDQLLGFALVPLSEVLFSNGKLEKELSLSSTDLFHSPAGFLQLSLAYCGSSPEVIAVPAPAASVPRDVYVQHVGAPESVPCELDKIEFPDPKVICENHQMASEYFGIPCENLDSQSCSDPENQLASELGAQFLECFSSCSITSNQVANFDSPPSSVSTNGSLSASLPVSSPSSDTPKSSNEEYASRQERISNEEYASRQERNSKEKNADVGDAECNTSSLLNDTFMKPLVSVNIEPEHKMVQQDIVDMYMKSMQQFTDSLAKMKLPLDVDNGSTATISGNSSSDQKSQTTNNSNARVFYGSRAFF